MGWLALLRSRRNEPNAKGDSHLLLLRHLLQFIGANGPVPKGMFPRPRPTQLGYICQIVYGLVFLVRTLAMPRGKILIRGFGFNMLHGQLLLADVGLRPKLMACVTACRPFLVVKSQKRHPIAHTCAILGVDPAEDLHAYLSINALLIFFANSQGRPVVVHLATSTAGEDAIERHRLGMEIAHSTGLPRTARDMVPVMVSSTSRDGYGMLIQSRLPGVAREFRHAPNEALEAAILSAFDALLQFQVFAPSGHGNDEDLVFVQFPRLAGHWPEFRSSLEPLLARLQDWQRRRHLPGVLTHGDYWTRNVLFHQTTGKVVGIVDWERCRAQGTPGLDALHLALMSLAMERGRDIATYLEQIWTLRWETPFLARYVSRLEAAYGLRADDTAHLAAFLYCDEFYKLLSTGRELPKQTRRRLLELRPAIEAWIAQPSPTPADAPADVRARSAAPISGATSLLDSSSPFL